ncbi:hypothetical protein ESCO_002321 [Escovopsis weberi]|uniref:Uncharacterized protein n=1 Tax=Escovopsis weberi TaxID=150374 RepID=A0A0M9VWF7_ESCWE|nr:hypothetical protein ESCO_002321 [Escovopsis weberi]
MRFLTSIFVPALSAASLAGAAPGTASCPTVTRTATRCSTCPVEDCVILSSVSNPAGCPREMATRTISLPCGGGGCGGGCSTQYVFPASTTTTTTTTSRSNPGGTGTCVLTVTATTYPGIRGGCKFDCGDGFCVRDGRDEDGDSVPDDEPLL